MINALIVVVIFQASVVGFLASYFYGKLKMVHEQIVLIISILEMMTDKMLGDVSVEKKKKGKK